MAQVFISYKREEQELARALAGSLEAAGLSVWWDHRLRGGDRFDDVIEAAIRDSDCVLVLWSRLSTQSQYVRDEASLGLRMKKLLPIAVDEATPPFRFQGLHTYSITDWTTVPPGPDFHLLLRDIQSLLAEALPRRSFDGSAGGALRAQNAPPVGLAWPTSAEASGKATGGPNRKRLLVGASVTGTLVAALGLLTMIPESPSWRGGKATSVRVAPREAGEQRQVANPDSSTVGLSIVQGSVPSRPLATTLPASKPRREPASAAASDPTNTDRQTDAGSARTEFTLPRSVKGHTQQAMFAVSLATCQSEGSRAERWESSFLLYDAQLPERVTPIRAMAMRISGDGTPVPVAESWWKWRPGLNTVELTFRPRLPPGRYKFVYGFYLLDSLNNENPEFYSDSCDIDVH